MTAPFSPVEDESIQRLWATHSQRQIAEILGRSHGGVRVHCALLRRRGLLPRSPFAGRHWTEQETEWLSEHWGTMPDAAVAARLGRSVHGVTTRAELLGIRRLDNVWTMAATARLFGVEERRIHTWLAKGWIKGKRVGVKWGIGGLWNIDDESLEAFVRERPWAYDVRAMEAGEYLTNVARQAQRDDPWLTATEVCQALGWTRQTLTLWLARGVVPHQRRRLGKRGPWQGEIMVRATDLTLIRERHAAAKAESYRQASITRERARREAQRGAVA